MAHLENSLNSALAMLIQFSFTSQNDDSQSSDKRLSLARGSQCFLSLRSSPPQSISIQLAPALSRSAPHLPVTIPVAFEPQTAELVAAVMTQTRRREIS